MEKKNIFLRRRRKSETEKEENIWRRKISFCGGEERERRYFERENIFLWRRRRTKEEKEENITEKKTLSRVDGRVDEDGRLERCPCGP